MLWAAARHQAGSDRLGANSLHLRRERRGRDAETAVRLLLYQEHVARIGLLHHRADGQDRHPRPGGILMRPTLPNITADRLQNAMTIDVEDYFHVSAFDGVVPRS